MEETFFECNETEETTFICSQIYYPLFIDSVERGIAETELTDLRESL